MHPRYKGRQTHGSKVRTTSHPTPQETRALPGGLLSPPTQKIWAYTQTCYPRKQIVNNRPNKKRKKHTANTLLVKCRSISFNRKQQCACYHYEKRDARTQECAVSCSPKLDVVDVSGRFSRIKVKRIGRMTTYYRKHCHETNNV